METSFTNAIQTQWDDRFEKEEPVESVGRSAELRTTSSTKQRSFKKKKTRKSIVNATTEMQKQRGDRVRKDEISADSSGKVKKKNKAKTSNNEKEQGLEAMSEVHRQRRSKPETGEPRIQLQRQRSSKQSTQKRIADKEETMPKEQRKPKKDKLDPKGERRSRQTQQTTKKSVEERIEEELEREALAATRRVSSRFSTSTRDLRNQEVAPSGGKTPSVSTGDLNDQPKGINTDSNNLPKQPAADSLTSNSTGNLNERPKRVSKGSNNLPKQPVAESPTPSIAANLNKEPTGISTSSNNLQRQPVAESTTSNSSRSLNESAKFSEKRNCCDTCGIRTHRGNRFNRQPLKNSNVHYGVCIKCNLDDVPSSVAKAWDEQQQGSVAVQSAVPPETARPSEEKQNAASSVRSLEPGDSETHCPTCGVRTHIRNKLQRVPLKNDQVHYGVCIKCNSYSGRLPDLIIDEERRAEQVKSGLCPGCGVKTHVVSKFNREPLKNSNVYYGVCIKCNPDEVESKKNDTVEAARRKQEERKGVCPNCGVKTHNVGWFNRDPLKNSNVHYGLCIKCNPKEVPPAVRDAWVESNKGGTTTVDFRESDNEAPATVGSSPSSPVLDNDDTTAAPSSERNVGTSMGAGVADLLAAPDANHHEETVDKRTSSVATEPFHVPDEVSEWLEQNLDKKDVSAVLAAGRSGKKLSSFVGSKKKKKGTGTKKPHKSSNHRSSEQAHKSESSKDLEALRTEIREAPQVE